MLGLMRADVEKRRFTADEYYAMARAGVFTDSDRVELIEGEIQTMTPIGPLHAVAVDRAAYALMRGVQQGAVVRVQGPIRLNALNEPQPDIALLSPPADFYRNAHPRPEDVLLVVEIAESSLRYDREVKATLYARHGIVEYWLVDLTSGTITSYTSASIEGYRQTVKRACGESLAPTSLPCCSICVDDLL